VGKKHLDKFRGKMKLVEKKWLERVERKKEKKKATK